MMNDHLTGRDIRRGQVWVPAVAHPNEKRPATIAEVNDGEVRFAEREDRVTVGSLLAYWRLLGSVN